MFYSVWSTYSHQQNIALHEIYKWKMKKKKLREVNVPQLGQSNNKGTGYLNE